MSWHPVFVTTATHLPKTRHQTAQDTPFTQKQGVFHIRYLGNNPYKYCISQSICLWSCAKILFIYRDIYATPMHAPCTPHIHTTLMYTPHKKFPVLSPFNYFNEVHFHFNFLLYISFWRLTLMLVKFITPDESFFIQRNAWLNVQILCPLILEAERREASFIEEKWAPLMEMCNKKIHSSWSKEQTNSLYIVITIK